MSATDPMARILEVGMWPGTESNRRHEDFQSSALPTELPGQSLGILRKTSGESRTGACSCLVLVNEKCIYRHDRESPSQVTILSSSR